MAGRHRGTDCTSLDQLRPSEPRILALLVSPVIASWLCVWQGVRSLFSVGDDYDCPGVGHLLGRIAAFERLSSDLGDMGFTFRILLATLFWFCQLRPLRLHFLH